MGTVLFLQLFCKSKIILKWNFLYELLEIFSNQPTLRELKKTVETEPWPRCQAAAKDVTVSTIEGSLMSGDVQLCQDHPRLLSLSSWHSQSKEEKTKWNETTEAKTKDISDCQPLYFNLKFLINVRYRHMFMSSSENLFFSWKEKGNRT